MKLFVYGTLKRGGGNHRYLHGCKYLGNYVMKNHVLFDLNYGFPYMARQENHEVIGEVYEIGELTGTTLKNVDRLEGHPVHYKRYLTNYKNEVAEMYYYLATHNTIPDYARLLTDGYWPVRKPVKLKVIIDNREYHDTADKLVFHMRFFDGDRTPTNSDYMELFNKRSKLKLNTLYEEIFIRQCITHNVIKEII